MLWLDPGDTGPALSPDVGRKSRELLAMSLPHPPGTPLGFSADHRHVCSLTKFFFCILHTCVGKPSSAAKTTGKVEALGSSSSLPMRF